MNINMGDYFFLEWLIIEKGITSEKYSAMTQEEIKKLHKEWLNSKYGKAILE